MVTRILFHKHQSYQIKPLQITRFRRPIVYELRRVFVFFLNIILNRRICPVQTSIKSQRV